MTITLKYGFEARPEFDLHEEGIPKLITLLDRYTLGRRFAPVIERHKGMWCFSCNFEDFSNVLSLETDDEEFISYLRDLLRIAKEKKAYRDQDGTVHELANLMDCDVLINDFTKEHKYKLRSRETGDIVLKENYDIPAARLNALM